MNKISKLLYTISIISIIFMVCCCGTTNEGNNPSTNSPNVEENIDDEEYLYNTLPEMQVDADSNGRADALEYSYNGIQNYKDSSYLYFHPELDSALHALRGDTTSIEEETTEEPVGNISITVAETILEINIGDSFNPQKDIDFTIKDENGTDFSSDAVILGEYNVDSLGSYKLIITYYGVVKQVTLIVKEKEDITTIPFHECWLSVNEDSYSIMAGEEFNPKTDINFYAVDEGGTDATDQIVFSTDYNTNISGIYTITLTYEDMSQEVTLKVYNSNFPNEFISIMSHDSKVNDTLITMYTGEKFTNPIFDVMTIAQNPVDINEHENNTLQEGDIVSKGTYKLQWEFVDPNNSSIYGLYNITVEVIVKE